MAQKIQRDASRFRKLVHGKIKSNLGKYISHPELIGKKGKDLISIPLPQITLPHFEFEQKGRGGIGMGDGDIGQPLSQPQPGQGGGGAGSGGGGDHILEVELTYDEAAEILGEELNLPELKPKQEGQISEYKNRYTGIRTTGPESLRHYKRSYKRALKREISQGTYDPDNPFIPLIKGDKLYKAPKPAPKPQTQAVIIHLMDVSGSITNEMKEIIGTEYFWIDLWIKHHYKNNVENVYIIHDDAAKEVDEHTFYHTTTSGGTKISSGIQLVNQIIDKRYNPNAWNIYGLYRGDGDNFGDDNLAAVKEIKELLPKVNMFSYGEAGPERRTSSYMGMGSYSRTFYNEVENNFKDETNTGKVRLTRIPSKEQISDSIRATFEARQKMAATT